MRKRITKKYMTNKQNQFNQIENNDRNKIYIQMVIQVNKVSFEVDTRSVDNIYFIKCLNDQGRNHFKKSVM